MNAPQLTSGFVLSAVLTAVGCDSASSARDMAADGRSNIERNTGGANASDAAAASRQTSSAGLREATFDDLKFPMEKTDAFVDEMLTDGVRSLFGQRIRLRGYMYPTPRKRGIKQFVLVRDNMECCFGPGAALFDCVLVSMQDGATAEFSIRPIAVEGEFRFEPLAGPDGRPLAIFQMTGEAVK